MDWFSVHANITNYTCIKITSRVYLHTRCSVFRFLSKPCHIIYSLELKRAFCNLKNITLCEWSGLSGFVHTLYAEQRPVLHIGIPIAILPNINGIDWAYYTHDVNHISSILVSIRCIQRRALKNWLELFWRWWNVQAEGQQPIKACCSLFSVLIYFDRCG